MARVNILQAVVCAFSALLLSKTSIAVDFSVVVNSAQVTSRTNLTVDARVTVDTRERTYEDVRFRAFLVPEPTQISNDDLSQTVCKVMSQIGDVAEAVSEALEDGVITELEADLIEREFQGALAALGAWRARIRLHHDQGKH